MSNVLFCWIGQTDLNAAAGGIESLGPVAQTVKSNLVDFSEVMLFCNYAAEKGEDYIAWLQAQTSIPIKFTSCSLSSPTNFEEIYLTVSKKLASYNNEKSEFFFQLSSGTPAMAAVWIVLAKAMFPATLIEASLQQGVKAISFPFDLAADFVPPSKEADNRLEKLNLSLPPETPEFEDIIHRSEVMRRVVLKACKAAMRSVPVLIEGESGTGKELFARAIHSASSVRDRKFVAVNCGAIPSELVESHLFGHTKGAFTGANVVRHGYFVKANGGTLFLDEIGELPLDAQVKILRVLQEGEIVPVGATSPVKIDVRVVAATNRNLIVESAEGRFRMDLFYRLAVAILKLPPLREREGDLSLLIDSLLDKVNEESTDEIGGEYKKISASAKKILLQHPWPGNVRELLNTLRRMVVWSDDAVLTDKDAMESLILSPIKKSETILGQPVELGVNLPEIMETVAKHYLYRALEFTAGNKSKTSKLLSLSSYQTLGNWMKKYNINPKFKRQS